MFGNTVHSERRTQDQPPVSQPTNPRRPACGGLVLAADYACANFPLSRRPSQTLFRLLSHLFQPLSLFLSLSLISLPLFGLSFTFLRRRWRLRTSGANLPRPCFLAILFASSLSHPPRRNESAGTAVVAETAAAAGVRRVQPSASRLGLVSLVTAPHKGIAL